MVSVTLLVSNTTYLSELLESFIERLCVKGLSPVMFIVLQKEKGGGDRKESGWWEGEAGG